MIFFHVSRVMKCLETTSKDYPAALVDLLKCFHQLFATLNNLAMGYGIETIEKAKRIQALYPTLKSSDYEGDVKTRNIEPRALFLSY